MAVLIYNKMAERDGARFLAQAQAALFSAPPAARQFSRRNRALPHCTPGQAPSPTGMQMWSCGPSMQWGAELCFLLIVRSSHNLWVLKVG